ncbi:MAG TPA: hypothetical protein VNK95_10965 [Caldilineaceae bacterium]|nr:hypothetical protein [Caldilineaceae bacterium]
MSSVRRHRILLLGLIALIAAGVALLLFSRPQGTPQERLIAEIERELGRVRTVKGRLTISLHEVTLEQELWVQRPAMLRTETSAGPGAFQGTIVVLNDQEGWVYSPALDMATVVDRANYDAALAGETGAGSLLERMPDSILAALRGGSPVHVTEGGQIAGRATVLLETTIPTGDPSFPEGPLQVWLDQQYSYPLAWRDSSGRTLRFTLVIFNEAIDPVTFTFLPPPGASVHRVNTQP